MARRDSLPALVGGAQPERHSLKFGQPLRHWAAALVMVTLNAICISSPHAAPDASTQFAHADQADPPLRQDLLVEVVKQAAAYLTTIQWLHATNMCAVVDASADDQVIWLLWRDGKQIILWDEHDMPLAMSRRILKIPADVVGSVGDLKGSTYKVTKAWVNDMEARCKKSGATFRVRGHRQNIDE